MLKAHRQGLKTVYRIIDLTIIIFAVSAVFYYYTGLTVLSFPALPLHYKMFLLANLIAWLYFSNRYRLYSSKRMTEFSREAYSIIKTVAICVFIATIGAFFSERHMVGRLFIIYILILEAGFLLIFHYLLRSLLKYIRSHGYNHRQIVILGRNERALQILREIENSPDLGIHIIGFVDSDNKKYEQDSAFAKYPFIGGINDMETILRQYVVDEVFILLPIRSFYKEIEEIIAICEMVGIEVKISTDIFNLRLFKSTISFYGNVSVIDLFTSPKMNAPLMVKRLFDMAVSATGLLLLLPFFVVIMLLIKVTSSGPAFFKQQRVGYNGRLFYLYKFRTMVENAEALKNDLMKDNEMDGPVFKMTNDPRITTIGRFLRNTSIDELPQLINVLTGDMSLVGPRPPLPAEVKQYDLPSLRRLSMKPGITGIWQVSGRNAISFEKWMELDREYIDQWSLLLDFKILLKTIPVVLKRTGV
ncbi:MAG: sugar transferase [Deltaproteobacteria bacterium]|nr:sugar transferase [Deltaproteobacteria bacterium]